MGEPAPSVRVGRSGWANPLEIEEATTPMGWHYRIVRMYEGNPRATPRYELHELFVDDDTGEPNGMGEGPAVFTGTSPEGVERWLARALANVREKSIFEEPAEWAQTPK